MSGLEAFVIESNRIERIRRKPTEGEMNAHRTLLAEPEMSVAILERFVDAVAGKPLRDKVGMDVRVGQHIAPRGGPEIRLALGGLVATINARSINAYDAHLAYETLHPFLDGNGRSGRALWAWQMKRERQDPFDLGFLHTFYYQTLDASGGRS